MKGNDYPNSEKKNPGIVIGIHFSSDYIRCAVSENGNLNIVPTRYGELKTPILISFDKDGTMLLGDAAKVAQHSIIRLENLQSIIGKTFTEVKAMKDYPFSYDILDYHNKPYLNIQWPNGSLKMTAEEALAFLFKEVKSSVESYVNENVSQIVLSVPDRFTENQELALRAAINKGGLRVEKTIKDSVSAIYGYELNESEEEANIMIINVGKESMDVVINVVENNNIETLRESFVEDISEKVFDRAMVDYLMMRGTSVHADVVQELIVRVKSLRETLYVFDEVDFSWRMVDVDIDSVVRITRSKYDELVLKHVTDLLNVVTKVLLEVELKRSDISEVILIGSVFRIKKLKSEIRNFFFGIDIRCEKDLEEVVVEGAAIAAFLSRNLPVRPNLVFVDILTSNLGVEVYNGIFHPIVPIGSSVPIKISQQLTLTFNYQGKVNIKILEGNNPLSRGNSFLGEVRFDRVTHGLRGFVLFRIEFDVHRDGTIIFTAKDLGSATQRSILIKKDFDKDRQGSKMVDERTAEKNAKAKSLYHLRREIETLAYEIQSHILSDSAILKKIVSTIDFIILQQIVQETILWLENHSVGEAAEVEELKLKFEETIKPILARAF